MKNYALSLLNIETKRIMWNKNRFFTLIFCAIVVVCQAQQVDLLQEEKNLATLFKGLKESNDDTFKDSLNTLIYNKLKDISVYPETFGYPFDSLHYLGKIYATDGKLRLFTWNYPTHNGYRFNGLVLSNTGRSWSLHSAATTEPTETGTIDLNHWYGALYYEAIAYKWKHQTVYVLLGWAQTNSRYQTKIIDALVLDDENPHFGAPFFEMNDGTYAYRRVFRYDAQTIMNLFYDARKNRIVFDHLSPMKTDVYLDEATFGSDMSFDAYIRRPQKWRLQQDIKVKNVK